MPALQQQAARTAKTLRVSSARVAGVITLMIDKLNIKDNIQLVFMFYILILVMMSFSNFMQHGKIVKGANAENTCFMPIYIYSGQPSYVASFCTSDSNTLFIARIFKANPSLNSYGNVYDYLFFIPTFILGISFWFLFAKKVLSNFVPKL